MTTTTFSLPDLRKAVTGQVIVPGDPEYDQARGVFYGGHDWRPAVIVRAADAHDVAHVVSVARESGVPFAVRSGGHSVHAGCDDGIVLDLSATKTIEFDLAGHTVWADAGLTAAELTTAAAEHGLAIGFGDTGSVGISGVTLGGGIGYLVRKYGMTIDNLLAADVVTADGQLRRVDAEHEPDLFWALRGGGGNFGVVTRLRFQLQEVGGVYGGLLVLPATAENLVNYVELSRTAPDELSSIVNIMPAPPMPFLAEEHHGKVILMAMLVYAGEGAAAEQAVAPFQALDEPLADFIAPMAYPDVLAPDDGEHPIAASRNTFVDGIDTEAAALMLDRLESSTALMPAVQVRVLGGAMARVPADATAFAHRDRAIMLNLAAIYEDLAETGTHRKWVDDFLLAVQRGVDGMYVNFLADDSEARIREAYPAATYERLVEVKRRYDPENLFRLNNNILPG